MQPRALCQLQPGSMKCVWPRRHSSASALCTEKCVHAPHSSAIIVLLLHLHCHVHLPSRASWCAAAAHHCWRQYTPPAPPPGPLAPAFSSPQSTCLLATTTLSAPCKAQQPPSVSHTPQPLVWGFNLQLLNSKHVCCRCNTPPWSCAGSCCTAGSAAWRRQQHLTVLFHLPATIPCTTLNLPLIFPSQPHNSHMPHLLVWIQFPAASLQTFLLAPQHSTLAAAAHHHDVPLGTVRLNLPATNPFRSLIPPPPEPRLLLWDQCPLLDLWQPASAAQHQHMMKTLHQTVHINLPATNHHFALTPLPPGIWGHNTVLTFWYGFNLQLPHSVHVC